MDLLLKRLYCIFVDLKSLINLWYKKNQGKLAKGQVWLKGHTCLSFFKQLVYCWKSCHQICFEPLSLLIRVCTYNKYLTVDNLTGIEFTHGITTLTSRGFRQCYNPYTGIQRSVTTITTAVSVYSDSHLLHCTTDDISIVYYINDVNGKLTLNKTQ